MSNKDVFFWMNEGLSYQLKELYEDAIKYYDKGLSIDSKFIPLLGLKATVLEFLERYEEALVYFNKIIEIDNSDQTSWIGKGETLAKLKQFKEALECFDEVIKIDPNSAEAWKHKGYILMGLGKYTESIICYDKVLIIDPTNKSVLRSKKIAENIVNRKPTNLINEFDEETQINFLLNMYFQPGYLPSLDPPKAFYYNTIGAGYIKIKDYKRAEAYLLRAIMLCLGCADAYHNLGVLYYELEKYELAEKMFQMESDINGREPKVFLSPEKKLDLKNMLIEIYGSYINEIFNEMLHELEKR